MIKETYNIYIDYQVNNGILFNPVKADDKVLREKWIDSIYSIHLNDFNKLFSHLSEQFNNKISNIGLHDQVKLGIHQDNDDRYIIVYISTDVNNIDELPIKELDAYLRIVTEGIIEYTTSRDGYTKCKFILITADEKSINIEWVDDYHDRVYNLTDPKYNGLISLNDCNNTSKSYTFENGWTIVNHLLSSVYVKCDNK